jgi:tetratricopeptide (TPR) repeat protein
MSEQALINPADAHTSLEKARVAHERYLLCQHNGDLEEAVENYINAVKLDPTIPESYYRLAALMWEQGEISVATAIEQCKAAIELSPHNIDAHLYTGYFMKMAQDFAAAEKEFKSAIKMGKLKSARPRLVLSEALLDKIGCGKANPADYMSFMYYFLSGSMMLAWDKPSIKMFCKNFSDNVSVLTFNAAGKFLERMKMYPAAENIYKKAVDKTKHGEIFYHKMGDMSLKNKEVDEAAECYRSALAANPLNREVLIKLATVLQTYCPEQTEETIDCYERLLQFGEDCGQIYYELGHLYLRKEDKINSVSAFKLALEHDEYNPFYNNSLAFAYTKSELYDEAIEHYQKAISVNPDNEWTSIVCQALGAIYGEIKGNVEAAISAYHAGLILDPSNYDLYLALGDIYMADYDLDRAIRSYCDAITLNPEDPRGYTKAGIALWEKDYLEEALVSYHKAVDLDPENANAQNNLGILYLDGLGDAMEALEYFERAIELKPDYTLAYFNAGRASQMVDFINDAANYYQQAIDLNKISEDLDEADIQARLYSLFDI